MYHMLNTRELTVLQKMLFEGTEKAFSAVSQNGREVDSAHCHSAMHCELAHLFFEAAGELYQRLGHTAAAA
jgi:hypothetical protein